MSNVVKWALLTAGVILIIGLVVALPVTGFINAGEFGSAVTSFVSVAGGYLRSARGLINSFLTPFGISIVTGLLAYWFGKWAILTGIKITTWIYHFIFRG